MANLPQALYTLDGVTLDHCGKFSTSMRVLVSEVSGGTSGRLNKKIKCRHIVALITWNVEDADNLYH